jgi:hypothetical protein
MVKAAELGRTVLSYISRALAADPARSVAVIGNQLQPVSTRCAPSAG